MTEQEYIDLIIASVGGDTADSLLATNLPIFWDAHDTIADLAIRAAAVKVDALRMLLAATARRVDFRALDGASVNLSDMFEHFLKLLRIAEEELANIQTLAAGGGLIGQLTTTAPIMADTPRGIDPNARSYRGDPLRRRGQRD